MKSALLKAIEIVGTQTALAKKCGVKPQQILKWLKRGVPPKRVLMVVKACKGKVAAHDLRPDIYPNKYQVM